MRLGIDAEVVERIVAASERDVCFLRGGGLGIGSLLVFVAALSGAYTDETL